MKTSQILPDDYQVETGQSSEYEKTILEILSPIRGSITALHFHREEQQANELHELHTKLVDILNISYLTLGLVGEAGEVAEKVKKVIRDKKGVVVEPDGFVGELGDVQWYLARLSKTFGVTLNQVMRRNLAKLLDRKHRGVISGSGDNR